MEDFGEEVICTGALKDAKKFAKQEKKRHSSHREDNRHEKARRS